MEPPCDAPRVTHSKASSGPSISHSMRSTSEILPAKAGTGGRFEGRGSTAVRPTYFFVVSFQMTSPKGNHRNIQTSTRLPEGQGSTDWAASLPPCIRERTRARGHRRSLGRGPPCAWVFFEAQHCVFPSKTHQHTVDQSPPPGV